MSKFDFTDIKNDFLVHISQNFQLHSRHSKLWTGSIHLTSLHYLSKYSLFRLSIPSTEKQNRRRATDHKTISSSCPINSDSYRDGLTSVPIDRNTTSDVRRKDDGGNKSRWKTFSHIFSKHGSISSDSGIL